MSTENHLPPQWADSLLTRLAQEHLVDEIRGDLLEAYLIDVKKMGVQRAKRRYVINALGFLARNFFWKRKKQNFYYTSMTGSYFKMARRSLVANKGTTLINILGLVIGIASALVIANVVRFEQSFDSFHSKKDDIWRLVRIEGADNPGYRSGISHPVPMALRDEIPGITVAPMEYLGATDVDVVMGNGQPVKKFNEPDGLVAIEPGFFKMFDFEGKPLHWIAGSPEKSLSEPTGIVITKAIAQKYFGNQDPMGRTLNLQKVIDVKVTGVVDDFPSNTDFPFKLMISYESLRNLYSNERINNWVSVNDNHHAYIYAPGMSKQELEERIAVVHAKHVDKDLAAQRHYRLQEFNEVHFDPRFGNFSGRTITHETILALQIIVLFLLVAGCINYINLSTAQSTLRSKEIGLRKVMGSQQRQLVIQFLTETFVVVAIAVVAAVILVIALMPSIKNLLNLQMSYDVRDPFILMSLAAIVISITLFAGSYPALVISRFNPAATLRAKFSNGKVAGVNLRKVLVVAQFTITQILAIGTFIVISQMNFFENVDMGFNRNAVVISMPLWNSNPQPRRATEAELRTLSFVSGVSSSFTLPSGVVRHRSSRSIGHMDAQSMNDYLSYEHFSIDESFLDLYQIKLIAGRNLIASDSSGGNLLINETLVKNLGFTSPEAALGSFVKVNGEKATIVGVIGDFYSNSLKEEADNTAMMFRPKEYRRMSVRLDLKPGESMTNALSEIENVWNKNYPDYLFQYTFMDDNINAFYQQEFKYSKLFQIFSMIFIGIGCLGLYGLISFIANKKGKEIAIRKTLGATISNIIAMFSREYVVLIGISFALALPIAWYSVSEWLSSFKNQVTLHWWMFAAPGAIVLAIALLVVGSKSYNAASINPVEKLKCE
jgi:putative ABC transport system permease protein